MNIVEGGTGGNFPKKHDPAGKHLNQIKKREGGKRRGRQEEKFSRCHEEPTRCQHHDLTLQPKNCCRKTFPEDEPRALFPTAIRLLKLTLLSDQSTWHIQPAAANTRAQSVGRSGMRGGASAQNRAGEAPLEVILRLRRRSAESASPPEKLLDPGTGR